MLFNSFAYLVFLPVVFLLYWLVFKSVRSRNLFVIAASYFFYGWWDWRFLALFFAETLIFYLSGRMIGPRVGERRPGKDKAILWANIIVGVGILFVFKYFNFFVGSLQRVLALAGWHPDWVTLNLVLPIGISFYTFQLLSYLIDVYKGDIKPERDAAVFFAYISFFPQLVAGPIERASNLIPQFARQRSFSYSQGVEGLKMILWGLFKKILVADNCAKAANDIFLNYDEVGALNLWAGMLLFSIQIFGDFSGYSDIAVGSARLFGIRLMQNFRQPYFARSPGEFWHRWHISLSRWLRDYIYIPLGGSRCSKPRTAFNLTFTFLVSGLWHGAAFNYIAWGGFHALAILPGSMLKKMRTEKRDIDRFRARDIGAILFTFLIVGFCWVLFRTHGVKIAADYLKLMFTDWRVMPAAFDFIVFLWIAALLILDWFSRDRECGFDFPVRGIWRYRWFRWAFYIVMVWLILIMGGQPQEFVYFQF